MCAREELILCRGAQPHESSRMAELIKKRWAKPIALQRNQWKSAGNSNYVISGSTGNYCPHRANISERSILKAIQPSKNKVTNNAMKPRSIFLDFPDDLMRFKAHWLTNIGLQNRHPPPATDIATKTFVNISLSHSKSERHCRSTSQHRYSNHSAPTRWRIA